MHCALPGTNIPIQKEADKESSFLFGDSLEKDNINSSSKDTEVSCFGWKDPDHRCTILTFFAVGPNGQWKIVALPVEHGPHVNHLGSANPRISVNANLSRNKGIGNKEKKLRKRSTSKKNEKEGKAEQKVFKRNWLN